MPRASTKLGRFFIPWFIALVGIAAAGLSFHQLHLDQEARIKSEFERRAQSTTTLMEEALRTRLDTLRTLQELYHCSDKVSRDEFERTALQLTERHTGIKSLKWAPRISAGQRERYENEARSELHHAFDILEPGPAGTLSIAAASKE